MTEYENHATVEVAQLSASDRPMFIEVWQSGVDRRDGGVRPQYSYSVSIDGAVGVAGHDLFGPAIGVWPEAVDMAVTLADFLGAAYECGELTEHGRSYSAAERLWLAVHSERLGVWACDMQDDSEGE